MPFLGHSPSPTQANSGSPKYYSARLSGLPMFRLPFLEARTRKTQISARHATKGRAGYSVFGKAPALAEPKAVGKTTPSQPCRRGPRVLRVAPQLLAAVEARQYALCFSCCCTTSRPTATGVHRFQVAPTTFQTSIAAREMYVHFWTVSTICPTFWRSILVSVCS